MPEPIRCLLIDDEFYAMELVENFLLRSGHYEVVGKLRNPMQVTDFLATHPVDLIFLDIQMPQMNGLTLKKQLGEGPVVIFTTAYSEFAHTAFDLQAADYLVKPFSFERFQQALLRAGKLMPARNGDAAALQVRTDRRWINIAHASILYIEGWKEYVRIHCKTEVVTTLLSMSKLESELPSSFIRIHRSFIVSKSKIAGFSQDGVVLSSGQKLPVARNRRDAVLAALKEK